MKKISEIPRWAYTEKGMSCKKRRDIAIFIHQFTLKELIIDNIKELQEGIDIVDSLGNPKEDEYYGMRTLAKIKVLKEIFEIEEPLVVTDRMQGVDCCFCEEGTNHIHKKRDEDVELIENLDLADWDLSNTFFMTNNRMRRIRHEKLLKEGISHIYRGEKYV